MMRMKEAIEKAKNFIVELNGEQEDFQVEEVFLSDDREKWFITLSYLKKIQSPNELQKTLGLESQRIYKRITVENNTKSDFSIVGMVNWSTDRR